MFLWPRPPFMAVIGGGAWCLMLEENNSFDFLDA